VEASDARYCEAKDKERMVSRKKWSEEIQKDLREFEA